VLHRLALVLATVLPIAAASRASEDGCPEVRACVGAPSQPTTPACPAGATVQIWVRNLTDGQPVDLAVEGELLCATRTCTATTLATTYGVQKLHCEAHGPDPVPCEADAGLGMLQPGTWVHRVTVGAQHQAQRSVVAAATRPPASNVVVWTLYPSVHAAGTEQELRDALCAIEHEGGPALISIAPGTIALAGHQCESKTGDPACASACSACQSGTHCAAI
jgi:hypothetical protein